MPDRIDIFLVFLEDWKGAAHEQYSRVLLIVIYKRKEQVMDFEQAVNTIIQGRYRHFKGKEYEVLYVAKHSETSEPMVVYRALYGDEEVWVRPAGMWNETVKVNDIESPRFTRIADAEHCWDDA